MLDLPDDALTQLVLDNPFIMEETAYEEQCERKDDQAGHQRQKMGGNMLSHGRVLPFRMDARKAEGVMPEPRRKTKEK